MTVLATVCCVGFAVGAAAAWAWLSVRSPGRRRPLSPGSPPSLFSLEDRLTHVRLMTMQHEEVALQHVAMKGEHETVDVLVALRTHVEWMLDVLADRMAALRNGTSPTGVDQAKSPAPIEPPVDPRARDVERLLECVSKSLRLALDICREEPASAEELEESLGQIHRTCNDLKAYPRTPSAGLNTLPNASPHPGIGGIQRLEHLLRAHRAQPNTPLAYPNLE